MKFIGKYGGATWRSWCVGTQGGKGTVLEIGVEGWRLRAGPWGSGGEVPGTPDTDTTLPSSVGAAPVSGSSKHQATHPKKASNGGGNANEGTGAGCAAQDQIPPLLLHPLSRVLTGGQVPFQLLPPPPDCTQQEGRDPRLTLPGLHSVYTLGCLRSWYTKTAFCGGMDE